MEKHLPLNNEFGSFGSFRSQNAQKTSSKIHRSGSQLLYCTLSCSILWVNTSSYIKASQLNFLRQLYFHLQIKWKECTPIIVTYCIHQSFKALNHLWDSGHLYLCIPRSSGWCEGNVLWLPPYLHQPLAGCHHLRPEVNDIKSGKAANQDEHWKIWRWKVRMNSFNGGARAETRCPIETGKSQDKTCKASTHKRAWQYKLAETTRKEK